MRWRFAVYCAYCREDDNLIVIVAFWCWSLHSSDMGIDADECYCEAGKVFFLCG